jgi:transcriptional regulator with XRE-family HTH domain
MARKITDQEFVKSRTQRDASAATVATTENKHQARLRRLDSDISVLCSSSNSTAAEPLGSLVRPVSISLTEEGESPTRAPISAKVICFLERKSLMHEAQRVGESDSVVMTHSLRGAVDLSQRLPVTAIRDNSGMPFPPEIPKDLKTIGARVRAWREYRKISRATLAKRVGYKSPSGLSDLELGESRGSEKLHLIAAELRLNPYYLEKGIGEPEATHPQEPPPPPDEWPFQAVPRSKIKQLNKIERSYIETELLRALAEIDEERRNRTA